MSEVFVIKRLFGNGSNHSEILGVVDGIVEVLPCIHNYIQETDPTQVYSKDDILLLLDKDGEFSIIIKTANKEGYDKINYRFRILKFEVNSHQNKITFNRFHDFKDRGVNIVYRGSCIGANCSDGNPDRLDVYTHGTDNNIRVLVKFSKSVVCQYPLGELDKGYYPQNLAYNVIQKTAPSLFEVVRKAS